jgi:hypothetical protein
LDEKVLMRHMSAENGSAGDKGLRDGGERPARFALANGAIRGRIVADQASLYL